MAEVARAGAIGRLLITQVSSGEQAAVEEVNVAQLTVEDRFFQIEFSAHRVVQSFSFEDSTKGVMVDRDSVFFFTALVLKTQRLGERLKLAIQAYLHHERVHLNLWI